MEKISEEESWSRFGISSGKKKEIEQFLEESREEIESETMIVLFVDECHLIWGDICGYVWGKTDSRIEVPIFPNYQCMALSHESFLIAIALPRSLTKTVFSTTSVLVTTASGLPRTNAGRAGSNTANAFDAAINLDCASAAAC